jgi:hypothetical protein
MMTFSLVRTHAVARTAIVLGAILASWVGSSSTALASADDRELSTEIRVGLFSASYRWSNSLPAAAPVVNYAEKSLYFVPSLGARFYPRGGHGALIELDYRLDADPDSACLVFCPPDPPTFRIDFVVAHAGYAYRHVVAARKRPEHRAWAFTPHVSLAVGGAFSELATAGVPSRSPVVGGRAGFDIDWHIGHFFMGWSFSYEILAHTRGAIRYSQFFDWNLIPLFRIGGVIGRTAAEQRLRR